MIKGKEKKEEEEVLQISTRQKGKSKYQIIRRYYLRTPCKNTIKTLIPRPKLLVKAHTKKIKKNKEHGNYIKKKKHIANENYKSRERQKFKKKKRKKKKERE